MNLHTTSIVISREYLQRVKKKSFLVTTFVVPVLFAALCVLPSVIMLATKESAKKIAVIDNSGIVMPVLQSNERIQYEDFTGRSLDSVKTNLESMEIDAVLSVSALNVAEKTVSADIFSTKPLGVDMSEKIEGRINSAVESYRVENSGISGLDKKVLESLKSDIKLKSYTMDDEGKETISESGIFMIVSMLLGMIIYLFIAIFGGMVMSSVIEEKASRVVEVLISSVKATELMFGKIIGIALVALTQFLCWIVLTGAIIGIVSTVVGADLFGGTDPQEMVQTMGGLDAQTSAAVVNAVSDESEMSVVISTVKSMPLGEILVCFVIFFLFGYMLYASLFAAIGSGAENAEDTQQLQIPVTIPLLLGFFIALYAFKAPDSTIAFWGSIIPFTSPIVMLARIPFGVPTWEVLLSIGLLIGTFILCAWFSAKVYRVGILMFGKKTTWKDLWKWFKQD